MNYDPNSVEQDYHQPSGGDDLPTYDDLVSQHGPNSRFGRWRGWIEKRAAERYVDLTRQEYVRRRNRGWGNEDMDLGQPHIEPPPKISIQTSDLSGPSSRPLIRTPSPPLPPIPLVSQRLPPTHLKIHQFGSRFLPHTTSPIRCLLPLMADKLLLIGHDEGLSVLDMFPQESSETGEPISKGPDEAQCRPIWTGEGVYQMSLLEIDNTGNGTPQGVVLVLVAPNPDPFSSKDQDLFKSLRMYSLTSLTSLAKWAVAQKGAQPLDLRRPGNLQVPTSPRRRRQSSMFTRGFKSIIDLPSSDTAQEPQHIPTYHNLLSPSASVSSSPGQSSRGSLSPYRGSPSPATSSTDLAEELPFRWATDFVPLASNGSRLTQSSVLSYTLWIDHNRKGRSGQLLAVATKAHIYLFETPKGERAFRLLKEFYTPLQPRSITFFHQIVQEVNRATSSVSLRGRNNHRRTDSNSTIFTSEDMSITTNYGTQLSLFVIFEKKVGWIRLADSAVGDLKLYDDINNQHQPNPRDSFTGGLNTGGTIKRSRRLSADWNVHSNRWVPPEICELPVPEYPGITRKVNLLTRGKQTHILPYPLPANSWTYPPLCVVTWRSAPTQVSTRVCDRTYRRDAASILQLVSLGEQGVEVQEISLSFMDSGNGKDRARVEEPRHADEDLGGDAGFLCKGGHWDQPYQMYSAQGGLERSYSTSSRMTYASMESTDLVEKMKREEGIYGWVRKGIEDWRVFWVGGSFEGDSTDASKSYEI